MILLGARRKEIRQIIYSNEVFSNDSGGPQKKRRFYFVRHCTRRLDPSKVPRDLETRYESMFNGSREYHSNWIANLGMNYSSPMNEVNDLIEMLKRLWP